MKLSDAELTFDALVVVGLGSPVSTYLVSLPTHFDAFSRPQGLNECIKPISLKRESAPTHSLLALLRRGAL